MKLSLIFFGFAFGVLFNMQAQTSYTSSIINPSFETGTAEGWTWTGATGYAWLGPNTDGDATKDGAYINGLWNGSIGDAECAQMITGLPNGFYQASALMTISNGRLTNQRLFATAGTVTKSMFYGSASNTAYSEVNLAILGLLETYSFGGYSESSAEGGPFKKVTVVNKVTDGTLTLGIRVSGKSNAFGYDFSNTTRGDAGFFKFDCFTLTNVSKVATLDKIGLSVGYLSTTFDPATLTYNAVLPVGTTTVTPTATPTVEGVTLSGTGAVDVSSQTGKSTLVVTSLDGSAQKAYTINYTVVSKSSDATLSALSTSIGTLNPAFNSSVLNYKVLVPVGTTTVTPSVTMNDAKSTVAGVSVVTLENGKGTSTIVVTAENGDKLTYTIQYDYDYLVNPSFETGDFTGWNWIGNSGYVWTGVNGDGDATKTGSKIAGIWNGTFGDVELSQTITGLTNGYYKVTADVMGSSNSTTSRLTTQRLFANNSSMLFGSASDYTVENLTVLSATEDFYFGGYKEVQNDAGPFQSLSVTTRVMEGVLTVGLRTNGLSSILGYTFPNLTAGNGHGWFKVDNFTMTYIGTSLSSSVIVPKNTDPITYSIESGMLKVRGTKSFVVYNLQGIKVAAVRNNESNSTVSLNPAIYIVKTEVTSFKIRVD